MRTSYTDAQASLATGAAAWAIALALFLAGCKDGAEHPPTKESRQPDETDAQDTGAGDDTGEPGGVVTVRATTPTGVEVELTLDEDVLAAMGLGADEVTLDLMEVDADRDPEHPAVHELAGAFLRFGPDGTEFPWPVMLEVTVPGGLVPAEAPRVSVGWWNAERERWEPRPAVRHVDGDVRVQAGIEHFSDFDVYSTPDVPRSVVTTPFAPGIEGELTISDIPDQEEFGELLVEMRDAEVGVIAEGPARLDLFFAATLDEGVYDLECWAGATVLWSRRFVVGRAVDGDDYQDLAGRFAPVLEFQGEEKWLPVPIDSTYFATEAEVSVGDYGTATTTGSETLDAMTRYGIEDAILTSRAEGDGEFWPSTVWGESGSNTLGDDGVQLYYSVHRASGDELLITYWTFYRHDPKSGLAGWVAAHDRDRESLTVALRDEAGDWVLDRVTYAGHRGQDCMRVLDDESSEWQGGALTLEAGLVDRFGDHPVAYVAEGSHALYPRRATYEVQVGCQDYATDLDWSDEVAGGGWRYCPDDAPACEGAGDLPTVAGTLYALRAFPVMSEVDGASEWRHLLFSGEWVDGISEEDATFPPYMDRYWDVEEWMPWASDWPGALAALGPATVAEDPEISEDCSDGTDDDGDGDADCGDSDCWSHDTCAVELTGVSPNSAAQNTHLPVTISGRNFRSDGSPPRLYAGEGIEITDPVWVDEETLTASFSVTCDAPVGVAMIQYAQPDETGESCASNGRACEDLFEVMEEPGCGVDGDGDGFSGVEDCDDGDATTYPGATERCDLVDNDCDGVADPSCTGPTYHSGTVTADEVWGEADGPHVLSGTVIVAEGVILTIEAGADIHAFGSALLVYGTLAAVGNTGEEIRFTSPGSTAAPGDWSGVYLASGSVADITYARIEYATTGLYVATEEVTFTDSEVLYSSGDGVVLTGEQPAAGDDPSRFARNTVTSGLDHPALVDLDRAGLLDGSNTLTGNAVDEIDLFRNAAYLAADLRLEALDVPWVSDTCSGGYLGWDGATVTLAAGAEWTDACGIWVGYGGTTAFVVESGASLGTYYLYASWFGGTTTLELQEGVTVSAAAGGLYLYDGTTLAVTGTPADPVVFTSAASSPAPGDWSGIELASGSVADITYARIEYATTGLYVATEEVTFTDSEVLYSSGDGVVLTGEQPAAGDDPSRFARNTVTSGLDHPALVDLDRAGLLDGSNTLTGNAVDEIDLFRNAAYLAADLRLEALDVPWVSDTCSGGYLGWDGATVTLAAGAEWTDACGIWVGYGGTTAFVVESGASLGTYFLYASWFGGTTTLELQEGVTVSAAAGGLYLYDGTTLAVTGTPADPVVFTSAASSPAPGDWSGIELASGSVADITYARIEYATTGLYVATEEVTFTDSEVLYSSGDGVVLTGEQPAAGDDPSRFARNTVTSGLDHPALVDLDRAGLLDGSNTLTGNAVDEIDLFRNAAYLAADLRLEALDVPWVSDTCSGGYLGWDGATVTLAAGAEWTDACGIWVGYGGTTAFVVESGASLGTYYLYASWFGGTTTLELQEGVTVSAAAGGLYLYDGTTLAVTGTPAAPVVFTSAASSPAPGDWSGILLGADTSASIDGADIRFAIVGVTILSSSTSLTSSKISNSLTYGIEVGDGVSPSITGMTYSGNPEDVHYD